MVAGSSTSPLWLSSGSVGPFVAYEAGVQGRRIKDAFRSEPPTVLISVELGHPLSVTAVLFGAVFGAGDDSILLANPPSPGQAGV